MGAVRFQTSRLGGYAQCAAMCQTIFPALHPHRSGYSTLTNTDKQWLHYAILTMYQVGAFRPEQNTCNWCDPPFFYGSEGPRSLSRHCCGGTFATESTGYSSPVCTDTMWRSLAHSSRLLCLCWRGSTSSWKTKCLPASPPTLATRQPQVENHHR